MEKLSIAKSREIVGGKGITGALLGGVGSVTKSISDFFSNTVGTIATTVFTAISLNKSDKLESKIGNSTFKLDNSASNKALIEAENKVPNVVNLF
ncbi:hypothetical protein [Spiroplasma cantharicola]|uniref:Uncharacterized protein n=1 Tax=Spiroplasma cantharicola TaxID=362837 RepID=A0A0M5KLH5_9MOLU|nr:hypothetical protein [Spiroplasma cantharicola]ALD66139.1 hypothetical protein SCANT_v1c02290 [Spiroplasma cantharicola]